MIVGAACITNCGVLILIWSAHNRYQVSVDEKSALGNTILHFAYDAGDKYSALGCCVRIVGCALSNQDQGEIESPKSHPG